MNSTEPLVKKPGRRWIVVEKGAPEHAWELSIVRANNAHGIRSYGWFGDDKLVVATSGGPCNDVFHPTIANMLRDVADTVCAAFNQEETTPLPLP